MKHKINFQVAVDTTATPSKKDIQQWAKTVLEDRQIEKAELSISIVSSDEIQQLNNDYRKKDKPTNVLSFPSDIPDFIPQDIPELGDIFLCHDVIAKEASEQNKPLIAHYTHLVIHGVLHLLGYDHVEDAEADAMEAIEIKIMHNLGYPNPYQHHQENIHE